MHLQMMVRYNRVDCLSHPVCSAYLHMKWLAYGFFVHSVNLLIYVIFLASLTAFVTSAENLIRTRRSVIAQPHAPAVMVIENDTASLNASGRTPNAGDTYDTHYVEHITVVETCRSNVQNMMLCIYIYVEAS